MTINIKKRRRERERALRAVFQLDYHQNEDDLKRAVMSVASGEAGFEEDTARENDYSEATGDHAKEDTRYAELIGETVIDNRAAIDERISRYIRDDWAFERIPEAEKAVLRVASAEMIYLGMPREIAINEAVELAKHYGEDNAPNYINGILHRMSVDIKKEKTDNSAADTGKASPTKDNDSESANKADDEASDQTENTDEKKPDSSNGWSLNNSVETDVSED